MLVDPRQHLTADLLELFEEELAVVRPVASGLTREGAASKLGTAMAQVFEKSFGLNAETARALGRLATEGEVSEGVAPSVDDLLERCALQRALVRAGLSAGLRSYFQAAGQAALAAFNIREDALAADGYVGRTAPVLPPIHEQDSSLDGVQSSKYFEDSAV